MTDNEIIKALECCNSPFSEYRCCDCPLDDTDNCKKALRINALDLINRQKAEIERLQERDETAEKIIREQGSTILSLQDEVSRLKDRLEHWLDESNNKTIEIVKLHHEIQGAKAEAIKEFAERLKERFLSLEYQANTTRKTLPIAFVKDQTDWMLHEVSIETIDNLVKEMVGDSDV